LRKYVLINKLLLCSITATGQCGCGNIEC